MHKFSRAFSWASIAVIIIGVLYSLGVLPRRQYSDADFHIATYHSLVDQDADGLDDQTDILQSARAYLATKPKYQSKYYPGGYPDDGHGVCTDVVAQGLRGAGYDFMELVDRDIREHPQAYAVDTRDPNIDFRRVQNLQTYFARHAQALTTNLSDISAWQGGDIVVFDGHIGIVSDRRNQRGVPYLIHHYSPLQVNYEEDALGNYEIIGHYRIS